MSEFAKNGSFDRLFPNQDFHKNLGLGNLTFQKKEYLL